MKNIKAWFSIIAISLLLTRSLRAAEQKVWYDEAREIPLWEQGYSREYQSIIYSESPHLKAPKQVLTDRIIVVFHQDINLPELEVFMQRYGLSLVKKAGVGTATYLFKAEGDKENSLQTANMIYKSGAVKAAYPDWLSLLKNP